MSERYNNRRENRENRKLNFRENFREKNSKKKKDDVNIILPIISIFIFLLAIVLWTASFGKAGVLGQNIFTFLLEIFGWPTYLFFLFFFFMAYYLWKEKWPAIGISKYIFSILLLISLTTFSASLQIENSGFLAAAFLASLTDNFGGILAGIISFFASIICLIIVMGQKPSLMLGKFIWEKILLIFQKNKNNSHDSNDLDNTNNLFSEIENKNSRNNIDLDFSLISLIKKIFKFIKNIFTKIINFIYNFISNLIFPKSNKLNSEQNQNQENILNNNQNQNNNLISEATLSENNLAKNNLNNSNNLNNLHNELLKNFQNLETENSNNSLTAQEAEILEMKKVKSKSEAERQKSIKAESKPIVIEEKFLPPDLKLLNADSGKSSAGDSKFKMNAIQKTLDQFGIPVEMGEVTVGPTVTQFTLKPAQGVNIKRILSLKDNLQMALSATNMHIEAPIPGRPFIGLEIPNEKKSLLGLRSLLELIEFQNAPALALAIGKNIIGKPIITDLGKMPHLLVAGATGTGKSVTLHNIIISLLYKNSPHDLKLIILDPKRVEFNSYNSLPHLYTPIIKEPKSAIKSLHWAAQEMDRRYDVLGEYGVANINDYNKKIFFPAIEKAKQKAQDGDIVSGLPPKMPFIVIVFDEYNDFMLTYPKEITPIITNLTQKARAAGIHLILTTQRPDVKVITGTIKANIPARIALRTTSSIDSRTILDQQGAEDLLGNGDMLYMNNSSITRVQAPFVSLEEIRDVIKDIKNKYYDFVPDEINLEKIKVSQSASVGYREMTDLENFNPDEEPFEDEDYMSARDYIISTGKASTSSLQTAFRWGYNKAARIINDLERYGIIGPVTSGRNREVLLGKDVNNLNHINNNDENEEENIKNNI